MYIMGDNPLAAGEWGTRPKKEDPVSLQSFYPVLMVDDVEASVRFYADRMGFEKTFESDWYVSLRHRERSAYELAVLSSVHETIPEGFRGERAGGLLLNFEVSDAKAEYERLKGAGLRVVLPLRDEAFGQRHFVVVGPGDVMIDVIEEIEPSPEFAEQFLS